MKRRPPSGPISIGDSVPEVLRDLGMSETLAVLRVVERWEAAVGPEIARHCQPTALRGRVLEAAAESSAWCQQLQMRREEILAGLRRELGDEAPEELWLRVS